MKKTRNKNRIKTGIHYSIKLIDTLNWWKQKVEYTLCGGDCENCFAPHCPCFKEVAKYDITDYIETRKLLEDYLSTNL